MRLGLVWLCFIAGLRAELPPQAWKEDLAVLVRELPARHIKPFPGITRAEFEKRAAALDKQIPSLSGARIMTEIQRLVASAGDSHTSILWERGMWPHVLPIAFYWFEDGLFIIRTKADHSRLLGKRLKSINGVPLDEIARRLGELAPAENAAGRRVFVQNMIMAVEFLEGIGVAKALDPSVIQAQDANGQSVSVAVDPVDARKLGPLSPVSLDPPPLYRSRLGKPYWMSTIENGSVLYLHYARCVDDPHEPMADFRLQFQAAMMRPGIMRLVVDLRLNPGGNSSLLDPLIDDLRKSRFNQKGRLAVLIGRDTASSGMLNALRFRSDTEAIVFGEATSGKPNHFGDIGQFRLPNSKATVIYSTKYFRRLPNEDPESMFPDVAVPLRFADYAAQRDPVLEAAIGY